MGSPKVQPGTAYRVKVRTTNALGDRIHPHGGGPYWPCERGEVVVVTDDPRTIFDFFGATEVLGVERIGVGYGLEVR